MGPAGTNRAQALEQSQARGSWCPWQNEAEQHEAKACPSMQCCCQAGESLVEAAQESSHPGPHCGSCLDQGAWCQPQLQPCMAQAFCHH